MTPRPLLVGIFQRLPVTTRDEIIGRINKWREGRSSASFRVHIPLSVDDQLERMQSDTLWHLEQHLEVMAQMASEIADDDPAWEKIRDAAAGLFRFGAHGFSVFFEVDRRSKTVMVSHITKT